MGMGTQLLQLGPMRFCKKWENHSTLMNNLIKIIKTLWKIYLMEWYEVFSFVWTDVDKAKPDEKSVMTYVADLYHYIADAEKNKRESRRLSNVSTHGETFSSKYCLIKPILNCDYNFFIDFTSNGVKKSVSKV